ncbi:MAG: HpcH/HpaI aldolase family protein [Planctomycetota bacterium]|jgi:4-hydroxy-2-oxoheptanedioate aldolase
MSGKLLREKLQRGERVLGTFMQYVNNPAIIEVLADQLDFVVFNSEHNALDVGDFNGMQFACQTKNIACLLRVHNRDPEEVAKACDAFPDGVVIPYAEDVEELRQLVAAAKYRPLKGESLQHLIKTGEYPSEKSKKWIDEKCDNIFFAPMIESVKSVENLDQICAIDGVDAVFVGPNDLTVSMGIPEERDNQEFIDIMQKIIDTAEKHGKAAGAHFSKFEHTERLIKQGGRFIPFASDARFIQFGTADAVNRFGTDKADEDKEKII